MSGDAKKVGASAPASTTEQTLSLADATRNTQQALLEQETQKIIKKNKLAIDPAQFKERETQIHKVLDAMLEGTVRIEGDLVASIQERIAQIDQLLNDQVNEIIHQPQFQQLESTWRGLHHLVSKTKTSPRLKIKVMHLTKAEAAKDLQSAKRFDVSNLFKKIYEQGIDTYGAPAYTTWVTGWSVGRSPADLALAKGAAQVAAAAHCPVLIAASPDLLNLDSYTNLTSEHQSPTQIENLFDKPIYAEWRALRAHPDSRYLVMPLPRMLIRPTYTLNSVNKVDEFPFVEDMRNDVQPDGQRPSGLDHSKFLWASPAYALAQRITHSYQVKGWGIDITGPEHGQVANLPLPKFETESGLTDIKSPVETQIPGRYETQLAKAGFLTLVHKVGTNTACFMGTQSVNLPQKHDTNEATASAALSAKLPYVLASSRISHYLKAIVQEKCGRFATREECQAEIEGFLQRYAVESRGASERDKIERPLAAYKVEVLDERGRPGYFRTTLQLKLHTVFEGMNVSLRLVTEVQTKK